MGALRVVEDLTLTPDEQQALADAEQTIERGLQTFIEVGTALAKVRDERLYREGYGTFEAYCRERWGIDRINAHRTIEAAQVVLSMDNADAPKPGNVRQARELAGLEPEQAADVMRQAHDDTGGKVTAKSIREARDDQQPQKGDPVTPEPSACYPGDLDRHKEWHANLKDLKYATDALADVYKQFPSDKRAKEVRTAIKRLERIIK